MQRRVSRRPLRDAAPAWPTEAEGHRRRSGGAQTVWLFDLDNTLHDASTAVFPHLRETMTQYIEDEVGVSREEAHVLRVRYWKRYGATLLGLIRHHGVSMAHFLEVTHRLPDLEPRLWCPRADREAIRQLPGRRLVLTNAPRVYALRVLQALRMEDLFDAVISVEQMRIFGDLRPKPDARMFRTLLARLRVKAADCVLVEDTLDHQKSAHALGIRTVWMQRYLRRDAAAPAACHPLHWRTPLYVGQRIRHLRDL